jgi:hypothetical protein
MLANHDHLMMRILSSMVKSQAGAQSFLGIVIGGRHAKELVLARRLILVVWN